MRLPTKPPQYANDIDNSDGDPCGLLTRNARCDRAAQHGGVVNPLSVLIVDDDDPDVLPVAATILQRLGYDAVAVDSGVRALEILTHRTDVVLLMTDLAMPGMDGLELVERAIALRPALKILYTSGHVASATGNPALRYGSFIGKPWRYEELRQQLASIFSSGRPTID